MKFTFTNANNDASVTVFGPGGTLNLYNGANIAVTDPMLLSGGTLDVPSTQDVQTTTATVQGNINDNGNIQIGDSNGSSQLNVTGDVDIESGRLTMFETFNNGALTSTDLLSVSGKFSIDTGNNPSSGLTVNTTVTGTAPVAGTTVTLVSAGSTATKSIKPYVFDNTQFLGGQFYKKGTLAGGSYYLTV